MPPAFTLSQDQTLRKIRVRTAEALRPDTNLWRFGNDSHELIGTVFPNLRPSLQPKHFLCYTLLVFTAVVFTIGSSEGPSANRVGALTRLRPLAHSLSLSKIKTL